MPCPIKRTGSHVRFALDMVSKASHENSEPRLPEVAPSLGGLLAKTLIARVLPASQRYVTTEVDAATFWKKQKSPSWFSKRGRVSGSSIISLAGARYRKKERPVSRSGQSFPVMRLRKRHFHTFSGERQRGIIGTEVLTPSPFASTIRSFSTQVPSDFLIIPSSQSNPEISDTRLSLTG